MKTNLIYVISLFLILPLGLLAQQKKSKKHTYKVWITLVDGSVKKGILYDANKEGLSILKSKLFDVSNLLSIEARKINTIKLRRKGSVKKFGSIGGIIGITAGYVIGSSTKTEDGAMPGLQNDLNSLGGAMIGGCLGATFGAMAGATRKEIRIHSNLDIYIKQLPVIQSYSLLAKK